MNFEINAKNIHRTNYQNNGLFHLHRWNIFYQDKTRLNYHLLQDIFSEFNRSIP